MECVFFIGVIFLDGKAFAVAVYSVNAACDYNRHIAKNLFGCIIYHTQERLLMWKKYIYEHKIFLNEILNTDWSR